MKYGLIHTRWENDIPYLKVLEELTHDYLFTENQFNLLVEYIEGKCASIKKQERIASIVKDLYDLKEAMKADIIRTKGFKNELEIIAQTKENELMTILKTEISRNLYFLFEIM